MTPLRYGIEGVQLAARERPDLFPALDPLFVKPPNPPVLEEDWSNHQRVSFLVQAFITFGDAHFIPYEAVRNARIRALAALGDSPCGRATYAKLVTAASVMAGGAWGELAPRVKAGKLPQVIAPHAWLLWRAQSWAAARARRPGTALLIERAFSANDLLSESTLRVFSHVAADLVLGAVRSGPHASSFGAPSALGQAARALEVRKQLVYRLGYSGETVNWAIRQHGESLALYDLRALHDRERQMVRDQEAALRAQARRGTWVWGRWFNPAHPATSRSPRLTTALAQGCT